ncbi:MAG: hypothetical protein Q4Q03_00870 [Bowdeniella nasicola]|nr:hypothetical protein [Bowdeniella nasicola]
MSEFSPQVARRTVVKGAAWAVPAVAVGTAAAGAAVSPDDPIIQDCEELKSSHGVHLQGADVVTWTPAVGTLGSTSGGSGTFYDMRLGTMQWSNPPVVINAGTGEPVKITGYRINWSPGAQPGAVKVQAVRDVVTDDNGQIVSWRKGETINGINAWDGKLTVKPNSGPLAIGAGLAFTGSLQTTVPYKPLSCPRGDEGGRPTKQLLVSFPAQVSFIKGLKQVAGIGDTFDSESNACYVYFNYLMEAGGNACGTYRLRRTGTLNMAGPHTFWMSGGVPEIPA